MLFLKTEDKRSVQYDDYFHKQYVDEQLIILSDERVMAALLSMRSKTAKENLS